MAIQILSESLETDGGQRNGQDDASSQALITTQGAVGSTPQRRLFDAPLRTFLRLEVGRMAARASQARTCGSFGGCTAAGRPCPRAAGWGIRRRRTGRCRDHIPRADARLQARKKAFLELYGTASVRALGLALSAFVAFGTPALEAQKPAPSVMVSFGVDTTAADVGDIVHLVRAYLARPDTSALTRGLWATADSLDRRVGDLHRHSAYQGFPATVLGVMSAGPGDSVYVVKVLHATADSTRQQVMPLALQRLYAVRTQDAEYGFDGITPEGNH